MTLILSVATPAYALHVGDRLVSKAGTAYDPLANKSIVFRATDGLLVLGYTGPACIDGIPTDTWLAEAAAGGVSLRGGGAVAYGAFSVRDVGSTLIRICEELRARRSFERARGEVSAVGWQWSAKGRRSLVRDVLWRLDRSSGALRWQQLVPRHLPERKRVFRMVGTGDWPFSRPTWQLLLDRVGAAGPDWQATERLLLHAIRDAHAVRPGTIGPHCMSILLRPWLFPNALVRFLPLAPHRGTASGEVLEVAYTPWMVAADAVHAPAILVGGMTCEQGLLTYSLNAPPIPAGQKLRGALQAQVRQQRWRP